MKLRHNMQYIVTKRSDNGALIVGDKVRLLNGWGVMIVNDAGLDECLIDSKDVSDALHGAEVKLDKQWLANRREKLEHELQALNDAQCSD